MKIVFLAPFGIRPKGTLIARMLPLASELHRLGHRVTIIATPYTNPEDSGRIEIVREVEIKNIDLGPSGGKLSVICRSRRMLRAAREEKPDLIHLFKPKGYGGIAVMVLLMMKKIGFSLPAVYVDTDDWEGRGGMNESQPYSLMEKWFFRFQEGWLLKRADAVTVASRALQTLVWSLGQPIGKVLYLPNCVDVEEEDLAKIPVRKNLGIPTGAPVVLLYTRFFEFSQEKLYFLFRELIDRVPDVRFLVVGKGRKGEEDQLLDDSKKHGYDHALFLAGWVEPVEIRSYLEAGDVAIYPFSDNLVNRTKCPAKLTELLAAGKPVVADRVGQNCEYIQPGLSGLLCEPDQWQDMLEKTTELLKFPQKRKALGAEGKRLMKERFSWQWMAKKLEMFYSGQHQEGMRGNK